MLLKPTSTGKDELLMTAFAPGGSSSLEQADFANARFFNRIVGSSGLGDFSSQQLTKVLTMWPALGNTGSSGWLGVSSLYGARLAVAGCKTAAKGSLGWAGLHPRVVGLGLKQRGFYR